LKISKRSFLASSFTFAAAALLLLSWILPSVSADMGGIPIWHTPYVELNEPGQKAIVAWNGREEILLLSTDVKANQSMLALELLPLPSNPKAVERADFSAFTKIQQILWNPLQDLASEYQALNVEAATLANTVAVTFHEVIGVHNITVVRADNASELALWISDFLKNNSVTIEISTQEYSSMFEEYISRGFPYFALDLIDVSYEEGSTESILYHFETDFLYYPLRISTLFSGSTNIKLFILTKEAPDFLYYQSAASTFWATSLVYVDANTTKMYSLNSSIWSLGRASHLNITGDKLGEIDSRLERLFDGSACLTVLEYEGAMDIFTGDLILRDDESLIVYPFVPSLPFGHAIPGLGSLIGLNVVPSNLISLDTLDNITVRSPYYEVPTLVDYHSPVIDSVSHFILTDGAISIQCQVEDSMSGIDEVTLFYRIGDEDWKSDKMRETNGMFVATIPEEVFKNVDFYIEASDLAGNKAIEDSNAAYYTVDIISYALTLILRSICIIAACILPAGFMAFMAKIYLKKRM